MRRRRKSGIEEKKKRVEEVESSEEEGGLGLEQMKVKLEGWMIVLIKGEKHYMRDFLDQKNLIFSYPEGKLKGQYIEKTQRIEEIDIED